MGNAVTYSRQGTIGVITVDHPPVNALSVAVRQGLIDCCKQGDEDSVDAMILHCAGRTFIAGADISEFGKPPKEPGFLAVLDQFENASKPIVAAIHGTALGGGLEMALICHYRCAVKSAQLGLPEVLLGIIPGAGGTQRLPRVVGVEKALEMITSGTPIGAKEALERGLVDEVISGDLLEGTIAFAKKIVEENRPLQKVRDKNEKVTGVDPAIFEKFRTRLARSRRGFQAPQSCVDAVEASVQLPFDEGIAKEQEIFARLQVSTQARSQQHIFFAERQAAKIADMPKNTPRAKVEKAAVVGAGTMGGGIAMNLANAGIPVVLLDTTQEMVDRGLDIVKKNYARTVSKGRLSQDAMADRMGLISTALDYDAVADADYVIEAVFEDMDIKKDVFAELDRVCKEGAVLATNTSTLDINEIASATSRPEAVVGTHFFSPANVMRLLEVVRGEKTSHETLAATMDLTKRMKKIGAVVGVCDGFVGNRMLHPYQQQAGFLLQEGALPQQVDKVIYDFGFAMGPFAVGDLAGLDVGWRIRKRRGIPKDKRYSSLADTLCEMGRFGQKTSGGYYKYEEGNRTPIPDPEVEKLILKESEDLGMERREIPDDEILDRCIYALVNEGARILEEGIAQRASDIDVIYIYGYGFPAHRGGPMFYADCVGLDKVYARVCEFNEAQAGEWEPAPLLKKLAEEGGRFNG